MLIREIRFQIHYKGSFTIVFVNPLELTIFDALN
jgi:hypothetical protein